MFETPEERPRITVGFTIAAFLVLASCGTATATIPLPSAMKQRTVEPAEVMAAAEWGTANAPMQLVAQFRIMLQNLKTKCPDTEEDLARAIVNGAAAIKAGGGSDTPLSFGKAMVRFEMERRSGASSACAKDIYAVAALTKSYAEGR